MEIGLVPVSTLNVQSQLNAGQQQNKQKLISASFSISVIERNKLSK